VKAESTISRYFAIILYAIKKYLSDKYQILPFFLNLTDRYKSIYTLSSFLFLCYL